MHVELVPKEKDNERPNGEKSVAVRREERRRERHESQQKNVLGRHLRAAY